MYKDCKSIVSRNCVVTKQERNCLLKSLLHSIMLTANMNWYLLLLHNLIKCSFLKKQYWKYKYIYSAQFSFDNV